MTKERTAIHESGSNIFADLGLPDAGNHFVKAQIVAELYRLTNELKLNQTTPDYAQRLSFRGVVRRARSVVRCARTVDQQLTVQRVGG